MLVECMWLKNLCMQCKATKVGNNNCVYCGGSMVVHILCFDECFFCTMGVGGKFVVHLCFDKVVCNYVVFQKWWVVELSTFQFFLDALTFDTFFLFFLGVIAYCIVPWIFQSTRVTQDPHENHLWIPFLYYCMWYFMNSFKEVI